MTNTLLLAITILLQYIAQVESEDNKYAIRTEPNGIQSAGMYQITDLYLKDVNQFAGTSFTKADRFDPDKAELITKLYLIHYGQKRKVQEMGLDQAIETLARIHNGGPSGHLKTATDPYWDKIKKKMLNNRVRITKCLI